MISYIYFDFNVIKFGRKKILIIAIVGFTLMSVFGGLATSLSELIAIRFIQGAFGAVLTPLSMSSFHSTSIDFR